MIFHPQVWEMRMKHRIRASTPPVVTRRKHTWETTPGFGGMPDLTIR